MSFITSLLKSTAITARKFDKKQCFHAGRLQQGFNEFYDEKAGSDAAVVYGREWTLADVRRKVSASLFFASLIIHRISASANSSVAKIFSCHVRQSFDDLHRLWFILYKERNLILTEKQKQQRTVNPTTTADESRYLKVKRSMAAIKHVLSERQKINNKIKEEELAISTADMKLL